jgi:FkbM family methyltransferase
MRYAKRVTKSILISLGLWPQLRAFLRTIRGRDEPEVALLKYLVPKEKVAIDIGANDGIYAFALLGLTSKVVCVEPNPDYQRELRAQFGERIDLICAALSDAEGTAELHIPIGAALGESLATIDSDNPIARSNCRRVSVPLKKLDGLGLDNVGFIKIDVEGHEEKVIRGGEELIRKCRPIFLVEVENRHRVNAVSCICEHMKQLGYVGLFLNQGTLTSASDFDPAEHQSQSDVDRLWSGKMPSSKYCNNFVFLPTSR